MPKDSSQAAFRSGDLGGQVRATLRGMMLLPNIPCSTSMVLLAVWQVARDDCADEYQHVLRMN